MAFTIQTWSRSSVSVNEPLQTLTGGALVGCARMYIYSSGDTQATIQAVSYFNPVIYDVSVGDIIFSYSTTDGTQVPLFVSSLAGGNVTTSVFAAAGTVGTGNITNLAVTAAKIANNTITDTQVSVNGLSSLSLNKSLVQYATGQLSSANIAAMYGAPISLIGAGGANTLIVVESMAVELQFVTTAYTGGGIVALQYGNTVHGGGPIALDNTIAATVVNAGASTAATAGAGAGISVPTANSVNTAVYITNATAAFATGDGLLNYYIWYRVVTTT